MFPSVIVLGIHYLQIIWEVVLAFAAGLRVINGSRFAKFSRAGSVYIICNMSRIETDSCTSPVCCVRRERKSNVVITLDMTDVGNSPIDDRRNQTKVICVVVQLHHLPIHVFYVIDDLLTLCKIISQDCIDDLKLFIKVWKLLLEMYYVSPNLQLVL